MKVKEHFEEMQIELSRELLKKGIKITAENIDQFTEEQFAAIRHTGFGASDSSKILGVNPFPNGTIDDLLNEKVNELTDETISAKATVRMGKDLEPFIIDIFEREMNKFTLVPFRILKPIHMYGKEENGLNTNFDGVVFEFGQFVPMEVKTISTWGRKHYNFSNALEVYPSKVEDLMAAYFEMKPTQIDMDLGTIDQKIIQRAKNAGIPPYYYTQLQQQIDFLDSDYGYLLALDVNDWTIRLFKIVRDNEVIITLNERAKNLYIKLQVAKGVVIEDDGEDI
jgi:hypothetical protein